MFNSFKYGGLGNLVEYDAVGLFLVKSQYFTQMPRDGFSFTVFIGCQPYLLGLAGILTKLLDDFFLFFRNLIFRDKRLDINAHLLLFQVTDMAVARHYLEVFAEEFFYRLGLGRRLNNHQILLHTHSFLLLL